MAQLITYKIVADVDGRLKAAARTACNFWNHFVEPRQSIVVRMGTFASFGTTLARAYEPYTRKKVVYGVVEFNTRFLPEYSDADVAGIVVHEIGHTLGYGWDRWLALFDAKSGHFKPAAVKKLPALKNMRVETDFGPGTTLSHWDEAKFGAEIMTGFKNKAEYVLPVTIDVAALLGHRVLEPLAKKTTMKALLRQLAAVQFTRKDTAKAMDLDHFRATPVWEETYDLGRRRQPLR
jgi:hypothetical protein